MITLTGELLKGYFHGFDDISNVRLVSLDGNIFEGNLIKMKAQGIG
jgi:hypothetical protein